MSDLDTKTEDPDGTLQGSALDKKKTINGHSGAAQDCDADMENGLSDTSQFNGDVSGDIINKDIKEVNQIDKSTENGDVGKISGDSVKINDSSKHLNNDESSGDKNNSNREQSDCNALDKELNSTNIENVCQKVTNCDDKAETKECSVTNKESGGDIKTSTIDDKIDVKASNSEEKSDGVSKTPEKSTQDSSNSPEKSDNKNASDSPEKSDNQDASDSSEKSDDNKDASDSPEKSDNKDVSSSPEKTDKDSLNSPEKSDKSEKKKHKKTDPTPDLPKRVTRSSTGASKTIKYTDFDENVDRIVDKMIEDDDDIKITKEVKKDEGSDIEMIEESDPLAISESDVKKAKEQKKDSNVIVIDTNTLINKQGPITSVHTTSKRASALTSTPTTAGLSNQQIQNAIQAITGGNPAIQGLQSAYLSAIQQVLVAQGGGQVSSPQYLSQLQQYYNTLGALQDDAYVIEAPSFIVPYVMEGKPTENIKDFLSKLEGDSEKEEDKKDSVEKDEDKTEEKSKVGEMKKKDEQKADNDKEEEEEKMEVDKDKEVDNDKEEEEEEKMEVDKEKEVEKDKQVDKEEKKDGEKIEVDKEDKNDNEKMEVDKEESVKEEKDVKEENKEKKETVKKDEEDNESESESTDKEEAKDKKEKEEVSEESENKENEETDDKKDVIDLDKEEDFSHLGRWEPYYKSALGKFFLELGLNHAQEFIQADLLKMQKRKLEKMKTHPSRQDIMGAKILELQLQNTKGKNAHLNVPIKTCKFCSFKTESKLVMERHLESPHMINYTYKCNFCEFETRGPQVILFHTEAEHNVRGRLERAPAFFQCPLCPYEDNNKSKMTRHSFSCSKKFKADRNCDLSDWEPPAKIPKIQRGRPNSFSRSFDSLKMPNILPKSLGGLPLNIQNAINNALIPNSTSGLNSLAGRGRGRPVGSYKNISPTVGGKNSSSLYQNRATSALFPQLSLANQVLQSVSQGSNRVPRILPASNANSLIPGLAASSSITIQSVQNKSGNTKSPQQPSISITPLPRGGTQSSSSSGKSGSSNSQRPTFVICEICDGYIKDLEQLRNHMNLIHKVKIHPKMIYNRPPLNCQKCQHRFFTDQGLERHLLGTHGLVTSSMQEAANKGKDAGRCPICGKVFQWKLLNHVSRDHKMTLKPAHLSYKCTVCTATFNMYRLFENHVYSAHSVVNKNKNNDSSNNSGGSTKKSADTPLKINDEITIIPQPASAVAKTPKSDGKSSSPKKSDSQQSPSVSKEITITKVGSRSTRRSGSSGSGVEVISLDDSPQKKASDEAPPKKKARDTSNSKKSRSST